MSGRYLSSDVSTRYYSRINGRVEDPLASNYVSSARALQNVQLEIQPKVQRIGGKALQRIRSQQFVTRTRCQCQLWRQEHRKYVKIRKALIPAPERPTKAAAPVRLYVKTEPIDFLKPEQDTRQQSDVQREFVSKPILVGHRNNAMPAYFTQDVENVLSSFPEPPVLTDSKQIQTDPPAMSLGCAPPVSRASGRKITAPPRRVVLKSMDMTREPSVNEIKTRSNASAAGRWNGSQMAGNVCDILPSHQAEDDSQNEDALQEYTKSQIIGSGVDTEIAERDAEAAMRKHDALLADYFEKKQVERMERSQRKQVEAQRAAEKKVAESRERLSVEKQRLLGILQQQRFSYQKLQNELTNIVDIRAEQEVLLKEEKEIQLLQNQVDQQAREELRLRQKLSKEASHAGQQRNVLNKAKDRVGSVLLQSNTQQPAQDTTQSFSTGTTTENAGTQQGQTAVSSAGQSLESTSQQTALQSTQNAPSITTESTTLQRAPSRADSVQEAPQGYKQKYKKPSRTPSSASLSQTQDTTYSTSQYGTTSTQGVSQQSATVPDTTSTKSAASSSSASARPPKPARQQSSSSSSQASHPSTSYSTATKPSQITTQTSGETMTSATNISSAFKSNTTKQTTTDTTAQSATNTKSQSNKSDSQYSYSTSQTRVSSTKSSSSQSHSSASETHSTKADSTDQSRTKQQDTTVITSYSSDTKPSQSTAQTSGDTMTSATNTSSAFKSNATRQTTTDTTVQSTNDTTTQSDKSESQYSYSASQTRVSSTKSQSGQSSNSASETYSTGTDQTDETSTEEQNTTIATSNESVIQNSASSEQDSTTQATETQDTETSNVYSGGTEEASEMGDGSGQYSGDYDSATGTETEPETYYYDSDGSEEYS